MKKGLGKGLGALITTHENDESELGSGIKELKINDIEPNIGQPRKNFDDEKLTQLSESIKQHGIVQPIIVKKENDTFKIVAGERRWRAARIAGLSTVPVIIREMTNKEVMEVALIENLQREDLNPIEEAEAFEKLLKEYDMTQEELANTVGRSRSAVANSLRLLNLSDELRSYIVNGELTSGHARALLAIEDEIKRIKAAEEIITNNLNVRDAEKLVKRYLNKKENAIIKKQNEEYTEIEDRLKSVFGTKVKLINNKNNKGKIMIEYYSIDELDRILEMVNNIGKK